MQKIKKSLLASLLANSHDDKVKFRLTELNQLSTSYMLVLIIVSKITYCEYKYSSWFALDLTPYSMNLLISNNSLAQVRLEKKEIPNKDY